MTSQSRHILCQSCKIGHFQNASSPKILKNGLNNGYESTGVGPIFTSVDFKVG